MQAVLVGNTLPMRCHKMEGMFFIPDGRCTVRYHHAADMNPLAPGGPDFLKLPVGAQRELHNMGDMDCKVQTLFSPSPPHRPRFSDPEPLALQAAVSQGATL